MTNFDQKKRVGWRLSLQRRNWHAIRSLSMHCYPLQTKMRSFSPPPSPWLVFARFFCRYSCIRMTIDWPDFYFCLIWHLLKILVTTNNIKRWLSWVAHKIIETWKVKVLSFARFILAFTSFKTEGQLISAINIYLWTDGKHNLIGRVGFDR